MDQTLILYNFELNNLKVLLSCEETTMIMTHYHPYLHLFISVPLSGTDRNISRRPSTILINIKQQLWASVILLYIV